MIDQQAVTTALFEEWDIIDTLITGLDDQQWQTSVPLPGWDVHDTVAHIIGTEALLLGETTPDVDVSNVDYLRNALGSFNEIWVRDLRRLAHAQLLAKYREVTSRRRSALAALSVEEWDAITPSTPVGPAPYGRFMRIRLFDCWMHELDIRDAVGIPGEEGGRRGELAFAEIDASLGYVIGKRGKAPAGARIVLELTGPLARTRYVAVDEKAKVVEGFEDPATVSISLDSRLYTRLAGGRTTAAAHSDEIAIAGDKQLGVRLTDNFAFTI